jgi:alpha-tubulin suppressor-like RCC1 family protein
MSNILSSGTTGQILTVDTTTATGLKWNTVAASGNAFVNNTVLTYNPTPTGNPIANYNQFVKGSNGKTYFIDNLGNSVLVDASVAVKATLSPVRDFTTTANLVSLVSIANDGDAWIVTDGANKGDIAIWDALNSDWIYYTPANGEYTTITSGTFANTSWFYQLSTDSWLQDLSTGLTTAPVQPLVGNLMLPKNSFGNARRGMVVIQNGDLTAWGKDPTGLISAGDGITTTITPHKATWTWNNLNVNISRSAQYVPKFTDYVHNYYLSAAVDHKGKLWVSSTVGTYVGITMTPMPIYGFVPVPFFQSLNEKIIDITVGNWDAGITIVTDMGNVYSTGRNSWGQLGNGTTTNPTSWVKMILPVGKFAKSAKQIYNMSVGLTLVLCTDNSLYGCGSNAFSQITTGITNQTTPVLVATNVKDYDSDGHSVIVVKNDNTLWVRGNNTVGQLGMGNVINVTTTLTQVSGVANASKCWMQKDWYTNAMSSYLTTTGVINFSGYNSNGCFGFGTANTNQLTFTTPVFSAQGSVSDLVLTRTTSNIITSNGDIWNCGNFVNRGQGKISGNASESIKFMQVSLPTNSVGIRYGGYYTGNGLDAEFIVSLMNNGSFCQWGATDCNIYNSSIIYSPQQVYTLALDNGTALSATPTSLMTQSSTLLTVGNGTISNTINNATKPTVTFTIPYTSSGAGFISTNPTISGTFGGSPVVISNLQSVIVAQSTSGSLTFTADITLANNTSLVLPNNGTLSLNVVFGSLSCTVTGVVNTDPMYAILTGSNLSTYTSAAAGTMIATELTATEVATAKSVLNTYGATNTAMGYATAIGYASNTVANSTSLNATAIPANKQVYVYGFSSGGAVATTIKLYNESLTSGVNVGTVTPTIGGTHYYTRKGGIATTVNSHIAFGGNSGNYYGLTGQGTSITKYIAGNVTTAITTNSPAGYLLGLQALAI